MSAQRKMDMRNFFNTVKRKGEDIAFANDGCFALMRSLEMQQNAQIDGTIILQEHSVPEGVEEDEIEEEINAEMGVEAVEE